MDAAYDAKTIAESSRRAGHSPLIDRNPRSKKAKAERAAERKRRDHPNLNVPRIAATTSAPTPNARSAG
jgi:hypothetical protein